MIRRATEFLRTVSGYSVLTNKETLLKSLNESLEIVRTLRDQNVELSSTSRLSPESPSGTESVRA